MKSIGVIKIKKIKEMYNEGVTAVAIADELNTSIATVQKYLYSVRHNKREVKDGIRRIV